MLENNTQLITYIGKKSLKTDTVAGTGIIWVGYGDTQEVMHVAAVKLLQHPAVWITKAKFDAQQKPKASGCTPPASVIAPKQENPEGDLPPGDDEPANNGEEIAPPGDGLSSAAPSDKLPAVKAAILSLDQTNEEHFSKATGNPIIAAVRNAANDATVSLKEVNAAWAELKK